MVPFTQIVNLHSISFKNLRIIENIENGIFGANPCPFGPEILHANPSFS